MPLYLIGVDGGMLLARAHNEDRARLVAQAGAGDPVHRVTEAGAEELIVPSWFQPGEEEPREIDITSMSDVGVRRFKNLDTGEERTVPR